LGNFCTSGHFSAYFGFTPPAPIVHMCMSIFPSSQTSENPAANCNTDNNSKEDRLEHKENTGSLMDRMASIVGEL
jgi:hypothetical protein